MSTYEFIVNSRDHRPEASDVEAGNKSTANRKLFKVQIPTILHLLNVHGGGGGGGDSHIKVMGELIRYLERNPWAWLLADNFTPQGVPKQNIT